MILSDDHSLKRRMTVVVWGAPLLIGCALIGGVVFLALILVVHWFVMSEFWRLAEKKGFPNNSWMSLILGSLLIIIVFVGWWWGIPLLAAVLLLGEVFRKDVVPFQRLGISALGWIYISLFLGCLVLIRQHGGPGRWDGAVWVLLMFTTIWVCDTAAYWGGSAWGKNPLHFKASPKKTVVGFVIGAAAGLIWALAWTQLPGIRYRIVDGLVLGVIVGAVGQAGDLVESLFKREAEVKDTSNLLGGHGGALDRFDSILFTSPVLLAYIIIARIWC
jgi:phosphatidate cytidylyltransferase